MALQYLLLLQLLLMVLGWEFVLFFRIILGGASLGGTLLLVVGLLGASTIRL